MKQVDTTLIAIKRRTRRHHRVEFKQQIVEACRQPDVSIAGVALAHGLNANLVRRWLTEHGIRSPQQSDPHPGSRTLAVSGGEFIPITVAPSAAADIRIEVRRGNSTVAIHWPLQAAGECAGWLRSWLR